MNPASCLPLATWANSRVLLQTILKSSVPNPMYLRPRPWPRATSVISASLPSFSDPPIFPFLPSVRPSVVAQVASHATAVASSIEDVVWHRTPIFVTLRSLLSLAFPCNKWTRRGTLGFDSGFESLEIAGFKSGLEITEAAKASGAIASSDSSTLHVLMLALEFFAHFTYN